MFYPKNTYSINQTEDKVLNKFIFDRFDNKDKIYDAFIRSMREGVEGEFKTLDHETSKTVIDLELCLRTFRELFDSYKARFKKEQRDYRWFLFRLKRVITRNFRYLISENPEVWNKVFEMFDYFSKTVPIEPYDREFYGPNAQKDDDHLNTLIDEHAQECIRLLGTIGENRHYITTDYNVEHFIERHIVSELYSREPLLFFRFLSAVNFQLRDPDKKYHLFRLRSFYEQMKDFVESKYCYRDLDYSDVSVSHRKDPREIKNKVGGVFMKFIEISKIMARLHQIITSLRSHKDFNTTWKELFELFKKGGKIDLFLSQNYDDKKTHHKKTHDDNSTVRLYAKYPTLYDDFFRNIFELTAKLRDNHFQRLDARHGYYGNKLQRQIENMKEAYGEGSGIIENMKKAYHEGFGILNHLGSSPAKAIDDDISYLHENDTKLKENDMKQNAILETLKAAANKAQEAAANKAQEASEKTSNENDDCHAPIEIIKSIFDGPLLEHIIENHEIYKTYPEIYEDFFQQIRDIINRTNLDKCDRERQLDKQLLKLKNMFHPKQTISRAKRWMMRTRGYKEHQYVSPVSAHIRGGFRRRRRSGRTYRRRVRETTNTRRY